MLAHAALGPSSADRWLNCPGSVAATANIPDPGSDHAREGTVAHHLTEMTRKELGSSPWRFIDKTVDGVLVTREMVECVEAFCDYVEEAPGDALIEHRVCFDRWVPDGFGTLDDGRLTPGKAVITDFKYGKGVQVFAKDNSQLKLYALGVLQEFDWLYNFETFVLCVHQPRLDHIDTWSISREDLLKWADEVVVPGAKAACTPGATIKAGSWCQWCRIKATCRVRAEGVLQTVVGDFENLEEAAAKAPRAQLTNDEMAVALNAIGNVEKWCKDLKAHALSEIAQGRPVGEWKVVEGRGSRQFGLTEPELVALWNREKRDPKELYVTKLATMPAVEKAVGKKNTIWQTEGLVVKQPGKPTLAPGSDPRPAIAVDPNAEFNSLGEDE